MKAIPEFKDYSINEYGKVFNSKTQRWLKANPCTIGYMRISLTNDYGKRKSLSVHRTVATLYVKGKNEIDNEVNHIDGDKNNNHYSNLEWCDRKYNMRHSRRVLKNKGNPKKTELREAVKLVKRELGYDNNILASIFKTTNPNISRLLNDR